MLRRTFLQLGALGLPWLSRAAPAAISSGSAWESGTAVDAMLHIESSDLVRGLCRPLFLRLANIGEQRPGSFASVRVGGPDGAGQFGFDLRDMPPRGYIATHGNWSSNPDPGFLNRGAFSCMLEQDLDSFTVGKYGHRTEASLAERPPLGLHLMVFRPSCEPKPEKGWKRVGDWDIDPDQWGQGYRNDVAEATQRVRARIAAGYRFRQLIAIVGPGYDEQIERLAALDLPGKSIVRAVHSSDDLLAAFESLA